MPRSVSPAAITPSSPTHHLVRNKLLAGAEPRCNVAASRISNDGRRICPPPPQRLPQRDLVCAVAWAASSDRPPRKRRSDAPIVQPLLERSGDENSGNCRSGLHQPVAASADQGQQQLFGRLRRVRPV